MSSTQRFGHALPRLRVPVGRKPMKLYDPAIPPLYSRLEALRKLITRLFREERMETMTHKAFECRSYAERLLQMAIEYGPKHPATAETCKWWMSDNKHLVQKIFDVYVPRYRNTSTAFTESYVLPNKHVQLAGGGFRELKLTILELNGNPFPPVIPKPENHRQSLLNILLEEARRRKEENERLLLKDSNESEELTETDEK